MTCIGLSHQILIWPITSISLFLTSPELIRGPRKGPKIDLYSRLSIESSKAWMDTLNESLTTQSPFHSTDVDSIQTAPAWEPR